MLFVSSLALAAAPPDVCPAYVEPALPAPPNVSDTTPEVLLSTVCGAEDAPAVVQQKRVVVDNASAAACWIQPTDVTFVRSAIEGPVSTGLHLVNPTRVRVSGVTWAVGDGHDRLEVQGVGADVDVVGNTFEEVGSWKTQAAAVRVRVTGDRDARMARVRIADNVVHRVTAGNEARTSATDTEIHGSAYGFQVVVARRKQRLTDLRVERNQLGVADAAGVRLDTGYSEVIALNGSICTFRVTQNHVAHYMNIGIDAMGGEGQGPGLPQQGRFDHNLVAAFEPLPASNPKPGFALYADGAAHLTFDHNAVWNVYEGMEASAENPVHTERIVFENNIVVLREASSDTGVGRGFRVGPFHLFASVTDIGVTDLEVYVRGPVKRAVVVEPSPGQLRRVEIHATVAGTDPFDAALRAPAKGELVELNGARRQAIADAPSACALFDLVSDAEGLRPAGC